MELDFSSQPASSDNNQPSAMATPSATPAPDSARATPIAPSELSASQPLASGASIPVSTVSDGNMLAQPSSASTPSTSGRMDEIMSEQVTTKNTDTPTGPAMPAQKPGKPKGSKLTTILLIVFLILLLGGGAYVALATDFGKNLLGLKTTETALVTTSDNLVSDEITGDSGVGSATTTSEGEAGSVATLPDETSTTTPTNTTTAGGATSVITQNDTTRKSHLVQIQTAVEAYKTKAGKYPISKTYSKATTSTSEIYSLLVPDFLDSIPQDPKSADGWWYGYKSVDGENYAVTARLEDATDTQGVMDGEVFLYILTNSS